MSLKDQLDQAAAALSIAGLPPTAQPGQTLIASVAPPQPLQVTELVDASLDLDLIAKEVVFANKDISSPSFVEDDAMVKIKPLFNLLTPTPTDDPSGTGGLIGKIKGTIPVPTNIFPTLSVDWLVLDENDNDPGEGTAYLLPAGRTNPTLEIIFLPDFAPLEAALPPPATRKIRAVVTLTAGMINGHATLEFIVRVPAIPFPRVLALSLNKNFVGAALVMVPGRSPITNPGQLKTILQPVRNVINALTSIARFAEMLIGIDTLSTVLDATNIAFHKGDTVANLNDIDLITRAWYENDTEAEDELSSFVYLSLQPPPGSTVENLAMMYNEREWGHSEGVLTVATGTSLVALCRDLHHAVPTVAPPNATLNVVVRPPGGWFDPSTFGDALSSLRLG